MDSFRSDFNRVRKLPDVQAETELRALLTRYPDLSSEQEGEVLYALGLAQFRQNRVAEARDTLKQTCRMFEHAEGAAPALAMTAPARAELACGDTNESVTTGRAALALLKARLAPEDPRLAPSLFSLSFGEYAARNMSQAEALCLETKELWPRGRRHSMAPQGAGASPQGPRRPPGDGLFPRQPRHGPGRRRTLGGRHRRSGRGPCLLRALRTHTRRRHRRRPPQPERLQKCSRPLERRPSFSRSVLPRLRKTPLFLFRRFP